MRVMIMRLLSMLFVVLASFLLSILPVLTYGANLVGIVVANTLPREENLGREHDVLKVIEELENIAAETELGLNLHLYIHEEYDSAILNKLEEIEVNGDDVLFFYFSGHGYRRQDKDVLQHPWPNLHIGLEDKGVDHEVITELLQAKGARLFFSLVNSCNRNLSREIQLIERTKNLFELLAPDFLQSLDPLYTIIDPLIRRENYRKLFLETSGVIISSSSKPGQYSFRKKDIGTIYLTSFLQALHEDVEGEDDPQWESIFLETVKKTTDITKGKQIPQYVLFLDAPE